MAAGLLLAMVIEGVLGWPNRLHARIGHPVTWLGRLITWLEAGLNRPRKATWWLRLSGGVAAFITIGVAAGIGWLIESGLPDSLWGMLLTGLVVYPLIAARSLYDHVAAVAQPLARQDIEAARCAVSMIVGRDPAQLDESGVVRAAIESLAENTSDGVVAPIFWGLLLGIPGIAAYKAINTLDSMIGHRTSRYEAFGWASARLDDLVNLIPARLTGLLFAIVSGRFLPAVLVMWWDAHRHRSPNAGWPEAAMAGALGVRLSGPRTYADRIADEPWLNRDGADAGPGDVRAGLTVYMRAMLLLGVCLAILAII